MAAASIGHLRHPLAVLVLAVGLLIAKSARGQGPVRSWSQASGFAANDIPLTLCSEEQARTDGRCAAAVVVVRRGWIVISSPRPLYVGERFYIINKRTLRDVDPAAQQLLVPDGEQTGMVVIEQVRGNQAAGRILRNVYAEAGDLAVPTSRLVRTSLLYGPRFPRTWRIAADLWLAPLLGSKVGFGLLSRAAVEYRFGPPIKLAVELGPGALVHGLEITDFTGGRANTVDGGTTFAGGVRGVIGLALSGFELSLGFGGAVDTGLFKSAALQMGFGFRIGSLDGLNVTVDGTFFLPGLGRDAAFGSTIGSFNIPVHRRLTLAIQGGGGQPMWALGAFGFRSYLLGTGGPGTVILHTSIGGGGMALRKECPPLDTSTLSCVAGETTKAGPLFQLGVDLRF